VFLVRKQASLPRLDGTYALIDDSEDPNWYDEFRWFQLNVVKPTTGRASWRRRDSRSQISRQLRTLADIAAFFPGTLLDIAV
jgi:hypothetical protein